MIDVIVFHFEAVKKDARAVEAAMKQSTPTNHATDLSKF